MLVSCNAQGCYLPGIVCVTTMRQWLVDTKTCEVRHAASWVRAMLGRACARCRRAWNIAANVVGRGREEAIQLFIKVPLPHMVLNGSRAMQGCTQGVTRTRPGAYRVLGNSHDVAKLLVVQGRDYGRAVRHVRRGAEDLGVDLPELRPACMQIEFLMWLHVYTCVCRQDHRHPSCCDAPDADSRCACRTHGASKKRAVLYTRARTHMRVCAQRILTPRR